MLDLVALLPLQTMDYDHPFFGGCIERSFSNVDSLLKKQDYFCVSKRWVLATYTHIGRVSINERNDSLFAYISDNRTKG